MSDKYKCHKCEKLIGEREGVTTLEGAWVCDTDSCRTLNEENEAHMVVSDKLQEIKEKYVGVLRNVETMKKFKCESKDFVCLIEQLEQAQSNITHLNNQLVESNDRFEAALELVKQHEVLLEQAQESSKRWEKAFDNADKQYIKKEKEAAELKRELEQAQAANQKLVECLEWYADDKQYRVKDLQGPFTPVIDDKGQRARQTLSEVKGNG